VPLGRRNCARSGFDGHPSPEGPRFIEVEDAETGKSINAGRWEKDPTSDDWFLLLELVG
jgi:hypothetical protein